MGAAPLPGTRWVSRIGRHTGNECEIVRFTDGDRIVVRHLGGGAAWGNQKTDGRLHTLGRDIFLRNYVAASELGQATTTGGSFRQRNAARSAIQMTLGDTMPLQFIPAEGHQNGAAVSSTDQAARPRAKRTIVNTAESGLAIGVETITPDLARVWLDRGGVNRRTSQRRVKMLVAAIQAGEWQLTGEAIKLDADGKVRDGKHRLIAIAEAGVPVQSLVIRNLPEPAFDVLDTGKARSPSDVLSIHGHMYTTATAACARGLIAHERGGRYVARGGTLDNYVSSVAILAYVESHPEVERAVLLGETLKQAGFLGGTGLWAIAIALFMRVDPEAAEVFVSELAEGAELRRDSPLLKLRTQFVGGGKRWWSASGENREQLLALTIKTWNAWRKAEPMTQLRWRSEGRSAEPFPVPI